MRHLKKKYKAPKKMWNKSRIEREGEIINTFGLRRKKEIWVAEGTMRKYRRMARELAAKRDNEKEAVLIGKMVKLGLLQPGATLDDVLGLTINNLLSRRLQTIVHKKGLANTVKQARQYIVHGLVTISGKKVVYPSYVVAVDEEEKIQKVGK
ncbi:30S ribosomal protein S4 [archaeon]|nr:MAG: 30S ribosomal protein S4 [archaeon]